MYISKYVFINPQKQPNFPFYCQVIFIYYIKDIYQIYKRIKSVCLLICLPSSVQVLYMRQALHRGVEQKRYVYLLQYKTVYTRLSYRIKYIRVSLLWDGGFGMALRLTRSSSPCQKKRIERFTEKVFFFEV